MKPILFIVAFVIALAGRAGAQAKWEYTGGPDGQRIIGLTQAPNGTLFASGDSEVFRYTKGALVWDSIWEVHVRRKVGYTNIFSLISVADGSLLMGTDDSIARSTNSGSSWYSVLEGHPFAFPSDTFNISAQNLSIDSNGKIWAVSEWDQAAASVDSGRTFQAVPVAGPLFGVHGEAIYSLPFGPTITAAKNIVRSFEDSLHEFGVGGEVFSLGSDQSGDWIAGTRDHGIGIRRPGGDFLSSNTGLKPQSIYGIVGTGGDSIFIATVDSGVYLSVDRGSSWKAWNEGLDLLTCISLILGRDGHLYVGTSGYGVYRSTKTFTFLHPPPAAVRSAPEATVAMGFDAGILSYPSSGQVHVFDCLGREMRYGKAEIGSDGRQTFDMRTLPHGSYIVVFERAGKREVLKIVI